MLRITITAVVHWTFTRLVAKLKLVARKGR